MNYQLLALDLDGTLTNSRKEITPSTRDALIDIQKNGKKVVLASGRGLAPDGDLFQMGQGVRLCAARAGEGPGHEHAAQEKDQAEATQHD